MNINKQEATYIVHLRKAKKAINFILILFFLTLLPSIFVWQFEQLFFIKATLFLAFYFSARSIFKYPILAVISLGIMLLFYLYDWFIFLTGIDIVNIFGLSSEDFLFYFILSLKFFATGVVIRGFFFALKGMIEKEQFEKRFKTLDEDELNN